mmetsp:Transcript_2643/g.6837  ORF Transcript_2643/g.6837 Transcript_2643/m.6837 type:complete len:278 (-) Transcript_2643:490-1323(-)
MLSSCAISTLRPVWGWLMVLSSSLIWPSSRPIWVLFALMSSFVFCRSSTHQSRCSRSFAASWSMRPSIFSTCSSTTWKGFWACSRARTLAMRGEEPAALARNCCAALRFCTSSTRGATCRWRRTLLSCMNVGPVAPVFVASTVPKVAKAASLLRMEMASERAASSLSRSRTRFLYSLALAAHMSCSCARKVSASSRASLASASWPFLMERSWSLPDSLPCFSVCDASISLYAASIVAMYLVKAVTAFSSVAVAVARLAPNVSFMSFRMPTTSPDCAV